MKLTVNPIIAMIGVTIGINTLIVIGIKSIGDLSQV
jgi:hypothetical protein